MKISSASKKVLASALSAAMVVAFAPTVAFGADDANVPADAVAHFSAEELITTGQTGSDENKTWTKVTKSYTVSKYGDAQAAMQAAIEDYVNANYRNQGALTLDTDVAGSYTLTDGKNYTVDLNGHTLTNDGYATNESKDTLILGTAVLTIKNGTVEGVKADNGKATEAITTSSTGKLSVVSGTYGSITADIQTIADGTFNRTVTDNTDGFDVKGGTFAVSSSTGDAVAISAEDTVNVLGKVSVSASTSKNDKTAVAVDGDVKVKKGGDLTATAASTAKQAHVGLNGSAAAADNPAVAGVNGELDASAKGATASVSATTKDDSSYAWGVEDFSGSAEVSALVGGEFDAKINTAASGAAVYAKQSMAIAGTAKLVTGGKYTGFVSAVSNATGTADNPTAGVTAGSFTDGDTVKNGTTGGRLFSDKALMEDGDYYTVYTKTLSESDESVSIASAENKQAIVDAVADVVEAVAYGDSVSNVKYAEGKTAADLKDAIKSGKVAYKVSIEEYKAKTATDAEAADYAAIEAAMKQADKYVVNAGTFSVAITNGKAGSDEVVYATLTNLGTANRGKARTFEFLTIDKTSVEAYGETVVQLVDGKVADVASKTDKKGNYVFSTNNTGMFATTSLSPAAIKDSANKGEQTAEKATQGIDVAKKSKTVKLAKKAKKTKKAQSFNLGATAQTGLTIAKASGNAKITVSDNGKVTLKKGAKKGTYKATVTISAASSDQYLAAAKTVTVKFVVKK